LSDTFRRTETSGKWTSWGKEKELSSIFGYLRYFFRFVGGRSFRFSRIIVDSSSTGVMGHMFARYGRRGVKTRRGRERTQIHWPCQPHIWLKSIGHSVYVNFRDGQNSFADGKTVRRDTLSLFLATFFSGKLLRSNLSRLDAAKLPTRDASSFAGRLRSQNTKVFSVFPHFPLSSNGFFLVFGSVLAGTRKCLTKAPK